VQYSYFLDYFQPYYLLIIVADPRLLQAPRSAQPTQPPEVRRSMHIGSVIWWTNPDEACHANEVRRGRKL